MEFKEWIAVGILLFLGWVWDKQKKEEKEELILEIKNAVKEKG